MTEIYIFYADVYLIQNLLMDYIALAGVNFMLRRRRKTLRLLAVSVFASLGSLFLTLLVKNMEVRLILVHFILNTVMVRIAFGKAEKKDFLENWLLIYFTVIFLGGAMSWEQENKMGGNMFFLQASVAALLLTVANFYLDRRKNLGNQIFPAEIIHRGRRLPVKAYWDSGNRLVDPYIGKPVCILERKKAECLFDQENDPVRFIPYSSLGNTNGLLPVCNADHLVVFDHQKKIEIEPVVIGIAEEGLLEGRAYDLILQVSVLDQGKSVREGCKTE